MRGPAQVDALTVLLTLIAVGVTLVIAILTWVGRKLFEIKAEDLPRLQARVDMIWREIWGDGGEPGLKADVRENRDDLRGRDGEDKGDEG